MRCDETEMRPNQADEAGDEAPGCYRLHPNRSSREDLIMSPHASQNPVCAIKGASLVPDELR